MDANKINADTATSSTRPCTAARGAADRARADITIEDAYQIQLRMIQRRVDAGETIVGKKIGVTSKVVMQDAGS
jgi:2-oxopent-4-enoate/cis-2-oxohex-4-enoate hydratase